MQPAEKSLRFWQGRDKELQSNQPATTNRGYPAWNQKLREAAAKLAQFQRDVDLQTQAVTKSQSLLDVVPKLREFIKGSHDQATIRYVVYSECGEQDLLLIDGIGQREAGTVGGAGTAVSATGGAECGARGRLAELDQHGRDGSRADELTLGYLSCWPRPDYNKLSIMTAAEKLNLISVEDYLAGELESPVKHEYLGGVVYAMAGAECA